MSPIPVIEVDSSKCVNCHTCISVCPVKFCINGSGDQVTINHDLCIGCGSCIDACTHRARLIHDDFDDFISDLKKEVKMIAIVAPSAAVSFGNDLLRLNSVLKSWGIEAVFDVSFGAELTVFSYLEYIRKSNPDFVIAQPCPAIVSYIETYAPELLPYLAPADSPMLHTLKMIEYFFPEYEKHRTVVISPCVAKKREFAETGYGDYNLTIASLQRHLNKEKIHLGKHKETPFDGPLAERAVLFSSPGGLLKTIEREIPNFASRTRKLEGVGQIYPYLKTLASNMENGYHPLLLDCLNCERGCNSGPGTLNKDIPLDDMEHIVEERARKNQKIYAGKSGSSLKRLQKTVHKTLMNYWKPGLYNRTYQNRSQNNTIKIPNKTELEILYKKMLKESEDDILNCASCGYHSCEMMATAIFNGLNKIENCYHYQKKMIEKNRGQTARISSRLHEEIIHSQNLVSEVENYMEMVQTSCDQQHRSIFESSSVIEQMIKSLQDINDSSNTRHTSLNNLVDLAQKGKSDMEKTVKSIHNVNDSISSIGSMIEILNKVAANTNLLSMNASIEAAHAGDAGKGFAVVASEVRRLAETSQQNSQSISRSLVEMINNIEETSEVSEETGKKIHTIIQNVQDVAKGITSLMERMNEIATGSHQITGSLDNLKEMTSDMKAAQMEMQDSLKEIRSVMENINAISEENLESLKGNQPEVLNIR